MCRSTTPPTRFCLSNWPFSRPRPPTNNRWYCSCIFRSTHRAGRWAMAAAIPNRDAATDKNYEIERRERWPETGHTPTTFRFHRDVFRSPHLMGILAGHIHKPTLDVIQGIPQVVTDANATGAYLKVEFVAEG
ncbi:MAG: hypothetical protein R3C61_16935 [Bacteroidia bacterium]